MGNAPGKELADSLDGAKEKRSYLLTEVDMSSHGPFLAESSTAAQPLSAAQASAFLRDKMGYTLDDAVPSSSGAGLGSLFYSEPVHRAAIGPGRTASGASSSEKEGTDGSSRGGGVLRSSSVIMREILPNRRMGSGAVSFDPETTDNMGSRLETEEFVGRMSARLRNGVQTRDYKPVIVPRRSVSEHAWPVDMSPKQSAQGKQKMSEAGRTDPVRVTAIVSAAVGDDDDVVSDDDVYLPDSSDEEDYGEEFEEPANKSPTFGAREKGESSLGRLSEVQEVSSGEEGKSRGRPLSPRFGGEADSPLPDLESLGEDPHVEGGVAGGVRREVSGEFAGGDRGARLEEDGVGDDYKLPYQEYKHRDSGEEDDTGVQTGEAVGGSTRDDTDTGSVKKLPDYWEGKGSVVGGKEGGGVGLLPALPMSPREEVVVQWAKEAKGSFDLDFSEEEPPWKGADADLERSGSNATLGGLSDMKDGTVEGSGSSQNEQAARVSPEWPTVEEDELTPLSLDPGKGFFRLSDLENYPSIKVTARGSPSNKAAAMLRAGKPGTPLSSDWQTLEEYEMDEDDVDLAASQSTEEEDEDDDVGDGKERQQRREGARNGEISRDTSKDTAAFLAPGEKPDEQDADMLRQLAQVADWLETFQSTTGVAPTDAELAEEAESAHTESLIDDAKNAYWRAGLEGDAETASVSYPMIRDTGHYPKIRVKTGGDEDTTIDGQDGQPASARKTGFRPRGKAPKNRRMRWYPQSMHPLRRESQSRRVPGLETAIEVSESRDASHHSDSGTSVRDARMKGKRKMEAEAEEASKPVERPGPMDEASPKKGTVAKIAENLEVADGMAERLRSGAEAGTTGKEEHAVSRASSQKDGWMHLINEMRARIGRLRHSVGLPAVIEDGWSQDGGDLELRKRRLVRLHRVLLSVEETWSVLYAPGRSLGVPRQSNKELLEKENGGKDLLAETAELPQQSTEEPARVAAEIKEGVGDSREFAETSGRAGEQPEGSEAGGSPKEWSKKSRAYWGWLDEDEEERGSNLPKEELEAERVARDWLKELEGRWKQSHSADGLETEPTGKEEHALTIEQLGQQILKQLDVLEATALQSNADENTLPPESPRGPPLESPGPSASYESSSELKSLPHSPHVSRSCSVQRSQPSMGSPHSALSHHRRTSTADSSSLPPPEALRTPRTPSSGATVEEDAASISPLQPAIPPPSLEGEQSFHYPADPLSVDELSALQASRLASVAPSPETTVLGDAASVAPQDMFVLPPPIRTAVPQAWEQGRVLVTFWRPALVLIERDFLALLKPPPRPSTPPKASGISALLDGVFGDGGPGSPLTPLAMAPASPGLAPRKPNIPPPPPIPGSRPPPPPPPIPGGGKPGGPPGGPPPPPPPPGGLKPGMLGSIFKTQIKTGNLRRSTKMGQLYRGLKGKVEGRPAAGEGGGESMQPRLPKGGGGQSKEVQAEVFLEIARRSTYFRQIEADIENHADDIRAIMTELEEFQTSDMSELLRFHAHVESVLEELEDEGRVLGHFEGFPMKKLETLRLASALYTRLSTMVRDCENWKITGTAQEQLERITRHFDKMKREVEQCDVSKDEDEKRFAAYNIKFDFKILAKVKEAMINLSSRFMSHAIKESQKVRAMYSIERENDDALRLPMAEMRRVKGTLQMLWRGFQLAFRVYNFAGGTDDNAEQLAVSLAEEMDSYPASIWQP